MPDVTFLAILVATIVAFVPELDLLRRVQRAAGRVIVSVWR
jgi:hypothetical protein